MILSRPQSEAIRVAYAAREKGGIWVRCGGSKGRPRKNTALSLARMRLAEMSRLRKYFRLTLAGCLLAAEMQSQAIAP